MSEAARVRESIDLAEFERRLRGAAVEEPTAYDYAPEPVQAAPVRAPFPRAAEAFEESSAVGNPVGNLRQQLEAAASRNDPFHAVVNRYPDAAARFAAAPPVHQHYHEPAAPEPELEPVSSWRPEAFVPADGSDKSRKRILLLGSAAAVLVIGLGVSYFMGGGATNGAAPTIRASSEPFKIQPETKPAGQKPSEAATILDRNGSERLAASRVVTREEQPVDVREAARQAAATSTSKPGPNVGAPPSGLPTAGPAANGNGYFPAPRPVRTVSVRPDGTIIQPAQTAPARPAPPAPRAAAPAPQMASAPPVRIATALPPKTAERAAPTTTASTGPVATPPSAASRAASPPSAAVAATPRSAGGAYAVQLAAPGSEREARSVISRLQQRYGSALGGRQPTVRKATVGSKDVYRVRVVGLSQGDATGLCEKLKSAGGSCFVARE